MPVTVVVGGQFGSEGKGKVSYFMAQEQNASIAVRVGGVNSGHTVVNPYNETLIFRQLPTASILPDVVCVLPAGTYIDLEVLLSEIKISGITSERLVVDPDAVMITEQDREKERELIRKSIGSTTSGTGSAVMRRISRTGDIRFAKDENALQNYIKPAVEFMREHLDHEERILIEGTQGFGLSLLHSRMYPYVTSRDTTASGFVSEAGLSPLDVDQVILTIRSFPIRVGGNSGLLPNEIDWDTVTKESGSQENIIEYTSVTNRVRRVARFHPEVVRRAISVNKPTSVVLNHLDYIDATCCITHQLTEKAVEYLKNIENLIGFNINYYGFGPASFVPKEEYINV